MVYMNRIAVLTSGGDAPGMNAAIRAVVRQGIHRGVEVLGVQRGYDGLVDGDFCELGHAVVEDIIDRGGTILKSARSASFMTVNGQSLALEAIRSAGIEGLVVIGGDGSLKGAGKLAAYGVPTIGIPATIDNDISGTDYAIGFDTAVNTAVQAIDRIRDTAFSHERIFVIEVMGREAGDIALWAGVCTGADSIIVPGASYSIEDIVCRIQDGRKRGKMHSMIVVAEGVCQGTDIKDMIAQKLDLETKVVVLGHLQRGGSPTAFDRMVAGKMGAAAVDSLVEGKKGIMMGWNMRQLVFVPLEGSEEYKRSVV